jgi:hypothetical protein
MESFLELPCHIGEDYNCDDCDQFDDCDIASKKVFNNIEDLDIEEEEDE